MNIAIVGSSGYIAEFLLKRFKKERNIDKVLKIDQNENADVFLDLMKPELFDYSELERIDYIIFTAAISSPDKCASDYEFCWRINVIGTMYFIKKALARGCKVLFFSSDAVFGDIPGEIYTEISETKAQTAYGKMKKAIEDEFKNSYGFKAIRLSYVVSVKDKFISYCLKCVENNEVADIFHPFYRNCITVSDVENVVVWLINHWNEYEYSVLNVAGEELVSRVRMADEINRRFKNNLKYIISIPGEEFYQNRPQITQMKSLYINKYKILDSGTFTEKIKKEFDVLGK